MNHQQQTHDQRGYTPLLSISAGSSPQCASSTTWYGITCPNNKHHVLQSIANEHIQQAHLFILQVLGQSRDTDAWH
jgi:hypothetical protein